MQVRVESYIVEGEPYFLDCRSIFWSIWLSVWVLSLEAGFHNAICIEYVSIVFAKIC